MSVPQVLQRTLQGRCRPTFLSCVCRRRFQSAPVLISPARDGRVRSAHLVEREMLDRSRRKGNVLLLEDESALRGSAVHDLARRTVAANARFGVRLAFELDGLAVARAVELALERVRVVVVWRSREDVPRSARVARSKAQVRPAQRRKGCGSHGITFGKSSSVWFLSACSCAPPMVAGLFGASWSSGFGFFAAGGDEGGSREGARVGRQRERSQLASERGREADAKMCGALRR
jgi:hypothetical protein